VASVVRTLLRPAKLLAPLNGSDRITPAIGDFYFWASSRSVTLPTSRYNYSSDWTPLLAGLAPAGTAASFAAPTLATGCLARASRADLSSAGLHQLWLAPSEKLIHAMSLDTDRPISRAEVVGCAISATRSHAQLFEITHVANIKSTLVQPSCQNAEVVEAFCRVAASRTIPVDQFTSPSVAALHAPAEIAPLHSLRFFDMQT
jgi:hypothetical protein